MKTNARETLSANLSALMAKTLGLETQAALAYKCGVAQSTIGRILRQEVSPTVDILEAIADAFGVPVAELVKDCDETVTPLDSRISELRQSDLDMIDAFIDFTVLRRRQENNQKQGLAVDEVAPPPNSQAAIERAIRRPMDEGTLNLDQESKPDPASSRRNARRPGRSRQGRS